MLLNRRKFTALALGAAVLKQGVAPARAGNRTGQLSGRRGYKVSGTVQVRMEGGRTIVVLGDDYQFDPSKNPPDIKIGFGRNERYASGSNIHRKLKVKSGGAAFEVPARIDTDSYDELYIYCEQFSVILAVAPLR